MYTTTLHTYAKNNFQNVEGLKNHKIKYKYFNVSCDTRKG